MVVREVRHFVNDIKEATSVIVTAVEGKTLEDYKSDIILRLALERAVEIISEASRHIPEHLKATRPEVPWSRVRGIGNVLRHEYHGLPDKIIWGVIQDEIPRLRVAIDAMLDDL